MEDTRTPEQRVGQRIRDRRTTLGLSQASLANAMRALGYPNWRQAIVAKTEAAERPLRVNEITDLAHALGVTVGDLLAASPQSELERAAALMQLLRARDDIQRLEHQHNELNTQAAQTTSELAHARVLAREAEGRLHALGLVEIGGRWAPADAKAETLR